MRASARFALGCLVCAALGCVPSPGPFRLAAVEGRVVDLDTGAPVAGAEVIEWYRGAGRSDASRPVYQARWTTTDAGGAFRFPAAVSSSPRMWLLKTYAPVYALVHSDYGLQRGGRSGEGELILRASRARAEQARADLAPYCRGEHTDAGARRIAEVACTGRPKRPASHVPN